jgi:hypothetical protein
MLDLFHLADTTYNTQVFYRTGPWETWIKPKGCKFIHFFVLGGGAGGAGGLTGIAGTNRNGGGGGGSSALTTLLIPAFFVPERLHILIGPGGAGGAASSNGTAGTVTYVGINNATTFAQNHLIISSSNNNTAGNSNAAAGTGNNPNTVANSVLMGMGIFNSIGGVNGSVGGTFGAGTNITISRPTTGGAGGGGLTTANAQAVGGNITDNGFIPTISGGAVGGFNGGAGFNQFTPSSLLSTELPLFFTGGAGGGSNASGTGGNGGDGSFGCGGGGGGAGLTGGRGGRGGDGLVIITCW